MARKDKPIIGHVTATVRFPLREGDRTDGNWEWFIFEEPGIAEGGFLATCREECETLSAKVKLS